MKISMHAARFTAAPNPQPTTAPTAITQLFIRAANGAVAIDIPDRPTAILTLQQAVHQADTIYRLKDNFNLTVPGAPPIPLDRQQAHDIMNRLYDVAFELHKA